MLRPGGIKAFLLLALSATFFIFVANSNNNAKREGDSMAKEDQKSMVTLYTKPGCFYCVKAKSYLEQSSISFNEIDISQDYDKLEELVNSTGAKKVPYIFIGDDYIGGCTEMLQMAEDGKLKKLLGL